MPDNSLPLSGIRVLDRCCVILRSGGGDVAAYATKNLGGRLREEQPPPQILRFAFLPAGRLRMTAKGRHDR